MERIGDRGRGSGRSRKQRRRRFALEIGLDGLQDEPKRRATLQCGGADHGPEPFVGTAAVGAAGALGNLAVDDDEAHRLLGDIIRRLHAEAGDEGKMRLGVLAKALGHVLRHYVAVTYGF